MLPLISTIAFQVFSAADFEFCYNFIFETPFRETVVIDEVISFDNPATRAACKQTTNVLFKETSKRIIQLQITGQVHVNQAFSIFHYIYSDIVIQDSKIDLTLINGTNADVSIVNWAVSEYAIEIFQSNISITSSLAFNSFMLLNTEKDLLINRSQIQYVLSGTVSRFYGISKELFGSKIENTTFDYQVSSTKGWAMVKTQVGALTLKNITFSGILSGTDVYGLVDEAQSTVSVDTVIFKLTLNALSQACAFVNQANAGKVTYKDISYPGIPGSPLNPSTVFGSSVNCPCFEGAQLTKGICYCTPESKFDSANSVCKCDSGRPLMNGLCKCPENSVLQANDCVCQPTNSVMKKGVCACDSSSFQTSAAGQTLTCQKCPDGATSESGTTCTCSGDYYYKPDNTCNKCPENSLVSNNLCSCDTHSYEVSSSGGLPTCFKCPDSSTPDKIGKTCICPNNQFYTSSNNSCTACGANSTVQNNICVCNANSYEVSNNAGSLICFTCPVNSVSQNGTKTCLCNGNFFYKSSDNTCVECPVDSSPDNTKQTCVCANFKQYISATPACQSCPLNNYYELSTNSCVPCDSGKFYNSSDNVCVSCLLNSHVDGNGCTCDSNSFQVSKVDGVATCTKCPDASAPDAGQTTCVCNTYFQYISASNICQTCPLNNFYVPGSNSCSPCPANQFYNISSNGCVACLVNSVVSGVGCSCNADSYQTSINSGVATCTQCPPGISDINGDQTSCICKNDFFYTPSGNSCTACPDHSTVSNNVCFCVPEAYTESVSGLIPKCFLCPANSNPDNTTKTCVCNGNFFYSSVGNSCTECPANSNVIDNICTCNVISGQSLQSGVCQCTNANAYVSGSACVCPTYAPLVSTTCTCPANSAIVSNACKCNSDAFTLSISGNTLVCQVCPANSAPDAGQTTCDCSGNSFYSSSNNSCTACGANSTVQNNICVCNANSYEVSNNAGSLICFTCPVNSVSQNGTKTCLCNGNFFYKSSDNTCVECPVDSSPDNTKQTCVCANFKQYISATPACQSCPLNNYYELSTNSCVPCDSGKFYNSSENVCVSCLLNSHVDGNGCTCDSNSFQVSKVDGVATCTKCPDASAPDAGQTTCVCNTYFQYISASNICQTCPLNNFYVPGSNSCSPCPANQFYNISSNGCVACLVNSVVSGVGCSCNSDSYQVSKVDGVATCTQCPSGSTVNAGKTSCDCAGLFFYTTSNNSCTACPTYTKEVTNNVCICHDAANTQVVNNVCSCKITYQYIELVHSNPPSCWCPYGCPDISNNACVLSGQVIDPTGSPLSPPSPKCVSSCSFPKTNVNGYCTCPVGATWDTTAKACKCTAQYKNGETVLTYSFWGLVEGTITSSNMKCCSSDKNYSSSTQQYIYYQCQDTVAGTIYSNNNNKWVCGGDTCQQYPWNRS
ncbi:Conserved_hypothetical protein [Hexamita inflata]|uniref:Uncharacterized protein n=1 Tax=Hexamita inflata TaxID=28002 RepID=A0AA86NI88_9EUKA|nr:Conserved hypothetical protein [Hexamita inflata]